MQRLTLDEMKSIELDITDEILEGLNAAYVKTKAKETK